MIFAVLLFVAPAKLNFVGSSTISVNQVYAQQTQATQAQPNASAKDLLSLTPVGQAGLVVEAILYFIQAVLYLLISITGLLFGVAVQFNLDLLQPANNVAVSVGWDIFRVITNLGFVLGIIIIAIGTIVRSRSYRAQQILWRLIVAALLVNFSLVIAGGILQVSDSLTGYFLSSLTGTQQYDFAGVNVPLNSPNNMIVGTLVAEVTGFFRLPNVVVPQDSSGWFNSSFLKVANVISHVTLGPTILELFSLVLTVVVFLIVFLTLLVLSLQVFVRYFFITVLLIVSPIVWLMWIFPFGQRWWREWWNHFIKWAFMLPLNLFFLWLAIAQLQGVIYGTMTKKVTNLMSSMQYVIGGNVDFGSIMGSLMAVGFIILGMKLSHKLGIAAADGGIKIAQNAGNKIKEKAARGAGAGFARVGGGVAAETIGAKMSTWAGARKGAVTGWVARETVGRAGKGLIGVGATAEKRKAEPVFGRPPEDFLKEYSQWTPDRLIKAYAGAPREQQLAILMTLESKKKLTAENVEKLGGTEALLNQADYLEGGGRKPIADNIKIAIGDDRTTYNARKAIDAISDQVEERNVTKDELVALESRRANLEEQSKTSQNEIDNANKELEDARAKGDLKRGGEIQDKISASKKVLESAKSEISTINSQIQPLKTKLEPLEAVVGPREKELNNARASFNSKFKKPEEQKRINEAIFSKEEEFEQGEDGKEGKSNLTAGQKLDRIAQAEFINSEPTGRRLHDVIPSMNTDSKLEGLMRSLVLSATKQNRLTGDLKTAFDGAFRGSGSVKDLIYTMKKYGVRDQRLFKRLEKQIDRTIAGDLGFSESGTNKEKENESSKDDGGKSEEKK